MGGYTSASGVNGINILYRIDTTTTNAGFAATDSGDLLQAGRAFTASTGGYDNEEIGNIAGGYNGSQYIDNIQYLDLATATSDAEDKGDINRARGWAALQSGDDNFVLRMGHDGGSMDGCEYWDITTGTVNGNDRGADEVSCHGPGSGAGYSGFG